MSHTDIRKVFPEAVKAIEIPDVVIVQLTRKGPERLELKSQRVGRGLR